MCTAAMLSQKSLTEKILIPKTLSKLTSQTSSLVTATIARYSALAEERATVACFLDFQETKASPKKMQKSDVDRCVSTQLP